MPEVIATIACHHHAAKIVDFCLICKAPEQMITIDLKLLNPQALRLCKEKLRSTSSSALLEKLGHHSGTQIIYDLKESNVYIYGRSFEDVTKGRELFLDVVTVFSYNVWPLRRNPTSILGSGFDKAIEFLPYKGPVSYIKESNGAKCAMYVVNPTEIDVEKMLAGSRGISDMSTPRILTAWFTEQFIEESWQKVATYLRDPGSADGICYEITLGKAMWAERDPNDEYHKLDGRVMDESGFVRIQNLGEAINWVFRRELDSASKNALVRGLVQRGYATSSPHKGVRITTVLTGSAEEHVWLCSSHNHGTDTFLSVDRHFARLRHLHDGTTLNPANSLDARTTIRATQDLETPANVKRAIKGWLVYEPSSGRLSVSEAGYKPHLPNYHIEQIEATTLTYGNSCVRIELTKSVTHDAPAYYKVTFTSVAIDAVTRPGGKYDERELQEAVEELDKEVKFLSNLFVLGEDGLREKGPMKQKQFCPTADDFKAMALMMSKKNTSQPIVKVKPVFEATTVVGLESTIEKPVAKVHVVEVEPFAMEEKHMVVESDEGDVKYYDNDEYSDDEYCEVEHADKSISTEDSDDFAILTDGDSDTEPDVIVITDVQSEISVEITAEDDVVAMKAVEWKPKFGQHTIAKQPKSSLATSADFAVWLSSFNKSVSQGIKKAPTKSVAIVERTTHPAIQSAVITQHAVVSQSAVIDQSAAARAAFVQQSSAKSKLASPADFMKWMANSRLGNNRTI
ncbi:Protein of unknown function [Pyronema omphalodes CBS 100304]|uniref:Uncharacterized protein n=1 Tax=Pyronema omphalodes (strain CBS 100304) TaxID=1076935 RepID=U4KZ93_PYROM|nr:Protein of unknown function [Pyronema omphalodes CBS 100304]